MANFIKANSVHSVVVMTPVKYNELYYKFNNLNKLLAWGHARAIENILEKSPCNSALADKFGDESLIQNALLSKGRNIVLKQMVRAEADIAVAAASVLARAEFVKRMQDLEKRYEIALPKGASSKVVEQAKKYIEKYSFERLNEVAKIHFKTALELKKNN
jgi:ribonuclease HIII